ncbi:NAD-dependent epimerase/dehydratase family protein [Candidatus Bathyarchaeota archaeon]|nr:NAD-dependent epimerase/dehydratase family protein [Candidatus Bathyarchaeota archaeon]
MKVLVIGGTGLISTAVTRFLAEHEDEVIIYTRGKREAELPHNIKRIVGDRNNTKMFEKQMVESGPFDCVIDMICFSPYDAENAARIFRGRIEQYIFISTVDVYTKPAKFYPVTEDAEKEPSPSFTYGFNKAACEKLFLEAHRRNYFSLTTIRPAYTYGEGLGILHTFGWGTYFLDRVRRGKPVIVHGDGNSFWAACHRDDVARAIAGAVGNEKTFGKAYNVTGEEWMTWNIYHEKVAEALDAPPLRIFHIPTDLLYKIAPKHAEWCMKNFQFNNIFNNEAAKIDLGFRYTVPFIEGVRRTISWLEKHDGFENSDDFPFYDKIIKAWQELCEGMKNSLLDEVMK